MIFELKNKMPRNSPFLRSEDVLTSTIFGNLRYFNKQRILIDFLCESIDLSNNKLKLSSNNIFEVKFWEKHYNDKSRRYNETDITLENNHFILIIECKYHSPIDEEYEITRDHKIYYSNQLIRYSKILLDKKYSNLIKIMIFLTDDKTIPKEILIKSKGNIGKNVHLYWLSWSKLYLSLMKQNKKELSLNELLLYNDLVELMIKRNMITFTKFTIGNISCNYNYIKQYKYVKEYYDIDWHYKRCYNYIKGKTNNNWRYKNERNIKTN
jgi:hypothetical protein